MKKVLHVSTECYPAAKVGGMGDVVGSLPLYLRQHDIDAQVIIPKYSNQWFQQQAFTTVHRGHFTLGVEPIGYSIQQLQLNKANAAITYPFYCVDIIGKFDRESIYLDVDGHGYKDEIQRYLSFQIAVVDWLVTGDYKFDALHCHDHMTGLIPFFMQYADDYNSLKSIPSFFTIHNGQYRGAFDWSYQSLLPSYEQQYRGLLDWDNHIHSLATAIKCAWQVTTVSPTYMHELQLDSDNLTPLLQHESEKCIGILNGIDAALWNPRTDTFLDTHLNANQWFVFKSIHKNKLLKRFQLKPLSKVPLISYIGRFAYEKGADLLVPVFTELLNSNTAVKLFVLGSGDRDTEQQLQQLAEQYPDQMACFIGYDEQLARHVYAASDFLLMPSRFEPCGLNQLFSMRYGTVPIVRATGGLIDTVPDIGELNDDDQGHGIAFNNAEINDAVHAVHRACQLYADINRFKVLLRKIVKLDYSWHQSASEYAKLYSKYK